jgi:hypothetical protein|tara:strand:+ start:225 stop:401 length:177 start_codon:yes stop_codon:yes gene_type:complete
MIRYVVEMTFNVEAMDREAAIDRIVRSVRINRSEAELIEIADVEFHIRELGVGYHDDE